MNIEGDCVIFSASDPEVPEGLRAYAEMALRCGRSVEYVRCIREQADRFENARKKAACGEVKKNAN